jgi:hypothetical protein
MRAIPPAVKPLSNGRAPALPGLNVKSPSQKRVEELLAGYTERFARDLATHTPAKPKTT